MNPTVSITDIEKAELDQAHAKFIRESRFIGCSTAAAAFLLIGALIVIGCSALCLTLPGVNAFSDVILPAFVPAGAAIILAIPAIVIAVTKSRKRAGFRKEILDQILVLFKKYKLYRMDKEEGGDFIKRNFTHKDRAKEFDNKLLGELRERFPKEKEDQTDKQIAIVERIDEARTLLLEKKKKR